MLTSPHSCITSNCVLVQFHYIFLKLQQSQTHIYRFFQRHLIHFCAQFSKCFHGTQHFERCFTSEICCATICTIMVFFLFQLFRSNRGLVWSPSMQDRIDTLFFKSRIEVLSHILVALFSNHQNDLKCSHSITMETLSYLKHNFQTLFLQ